jgi:hypothetical protein
MRHLKCLGMPGFEPRTNGLQDHRSSQLGATYPLCNNTKLKWVRTTDFTLIKRALYQLSYKQRISAGMGFEPTNFKKVIPLAEGCLKPLSHPTNIFSPEGTRTLKFMLLRHACLPIPLQDRNCLYCRKNTVYSTH